LRRGAVVALWLAAVAACAWIAVRATYTADLTAFLPRSVTPSQALLIAQLRDGVAARLVLVGLECADEAALAATSRALADRCAQATASPTSQTAQAASRSATATRCSTIATSSARQ
jgi:predicted exporter